MLDPAWKSHVEQNLSHHNQHTTREKQASAFVGPWDLGIVAGTQRGEADAWPSERRTPAMERFAVVPGTYEGLHSDYHCQCALTFDTTS